MPSSSSRLGSLFGVAAFGLWGLFPLYFKLLDRSPAIEVLGHRILWSLLVCSILVAVRHEAGNVAAVLRAPRLLAALSLAAVAIALNWGIYIYAVGSDQVIEASLGYFINPLVSVVLGVVVLHERLRPAQWVAVAVGAVAVVVLTIEYGHVPIIAISLALSFGLYGLIKNKAGGAVTALAGLTVETAVLAPPAAGLIAWFILTGRSTFLHDPPANGLLLASLGIATVVPLLFFAAAARRIPLSAVGLLQYLTPSLQLLCGVALLGEVMPPVRWFGFALVWVALVVLGADGFQRSRRPRALAEVGTATAASPPGSSRRG